MPVFAEPMNLGDLLKYEAPNLYSRERVTVAAGQNLPLGTVLGQQQATGLFKQLDLTTDDGSEIAAAVLLQPCDATLAERDDALAVARHAIVALNALVWPASITAEQKHAAIAQLAARGVLVRLGA